MGLCGPEGRPNRARQDIMAANGSGRSGTNKVTQSPSLHFILSLASSSLCGLCLCDRVPSAYISRLLFTSLLCVINSICYQRPHCQQSCQTVKVFFLFLFSLLMFLVWWSAGRVYTLHHVDVNSRLRFDVGSVFVG